MQLSVYSMNEIYLMKFRKVTINKVFIKIGKIIIMKPILKVKDQFNSQLPSQSNQTINHLGLPLASSINIILEKSQNQSEAEVPQSHSQIQSNISVSHRKVSFNNVSASQQVNLPIKTEDLIQNRNLVQQFVLAWKTEAGFSVILVQKLINIVRDYFKMLAQITKRNQEIQILIIYNKSLIDILSKFQNQQYRILHKLKIMEQLNIKIMKQLCNLKKKSFNSPESKSQQSIFSKFSLNDLKYESQIKPEMKINEQYQNKLQQIFKNYLLQKNTEIIPLIQTKIKQLQTIQTQTGLRNKNRKDQLSQLMQNVIKYNQDLCDINCQNMFDLYAQKQRIKQQMKNKQIWSYDMEEKQEISERQFAKSVTVIHSRLTKMNQQQIIGYLKDERYKRKKMRNLRIKQQQIFLNACEKIQHQNNDLKQNIASQKQKINSLEEQLSRFKAQIDFKNMKQKVNKSSNLSMDESMMVDGDNKLTKKMMKDVNKALEQDLKKVKDDNLQLTKRLEEVEQSRKINQQKKKAFLKKTRLKDVLQDAKDISFVEFLISNYYKLQQEVVKLKKGALYLDLHHQQSITSPQMELSPIQFNNAAEKFLRNTPQKKGKQKQTSQIQNSTKLNELQNQNELLRQKQKSSQNIIADLKSKILFVEKEAGEKDKLIKQIQMKQKNVQNDLKLKDNQFSNSLIQYKSDIKSKKQKIKEIIKQMIKSDFKKLTNKNQQFIFQNQCAQKLSGRIVKAVQALTNQDMSSQKFLKIMDKMLSKLKMYIQEYKRQTKKQTIISDSKNSSFDFGVSFEEQPQNLSRVSSKGSKQRKQKKHFQIGTNTSILKNYDHKCQCSLSKSKNLSFPEKKTQINKENSLLQKLADSDKSMIQQKKGSQLQYLIMDSTQLKNIRGAEQGQKQKYVGKQFSERNQQKLICSICLQLIKNQKKTLFVEKKKLQLQSKNQFKLNHFLESNSTTQKQKQLKQQEKNNQAQEFKNRIKKKPRKYQKIIQNNQERKKKGMKLLPSQVQKQDKVISFSINDTDSINNRLMEGSFNLKSNVQNSQINSSRSPQILQMSISQSNSQQFKLYPNDLHSSPEQRKRKQNIQGGISVGFDKQALQVGIQVKYIQMMKSKFSRLQNDQDILDFYELYQRYKQAVKCLEKAEQVNKWHQLRYQKFAENIEKNKQIDKSYSLQQQNYHLMRQVLQQKQLLEKQTDQFQHSFSRHIKQSQKAINSQLKMLRNQFINDATKSGRVF